MIREAEPRDAEALERLYKELLTDGRGIRVLPERLAEVRANPNSFLYVLETEEDGLIGSAHLHLCLDALDGTRPFGVVERVIVTGRVRGQGYGAQLMRHIDEQCILHRCVKVMLTSNAKRTEAHAFYRRMGYDGEGSKAFKKYLEAAD